MKKILFIINLVICSSIFALKLDNDKIIDNKGNSIENKVYNKIIILDPAVVETFYMLESEKNIVGIASTIKSPVWPSEKTKSLTKVGTITNPSLEKILSLNPDLVILNPMILNFSSSLKDRKINFLINEGSNFEDILNNLKIYGIISGNQEKANKLFSEYTSKLENIKNNINQKKLNLKGLFIFSTSPMMAFTQNSLPGEIFNTLGIENIAPKSGARPIISSEYLTIKNPDLIIGSMSIKNVNDILNSNSAIKNTTAGKNKNIFIIDSNKILRPSPKIIDELDSLYKDLYKLNN